MEANNFIFFQVVSLVGITIQWECVDFFMFLCECACSLVLIDMLAPPREGISESVRGESEEGEGD